MKGQPVGSEGGIIIVEHPAVFFLSNGLRFASDCSTKNSPMCAINWPRSAAPCLR